MTDSNKTLTQVNLFETTGTQSWRRLQKTLHYEFSSSEVIGLTSQGKIHILARIWDLTSSEPSSVCKLEHF